MGKVNIFCKVCVISLLMTACSTKTVYGPSGDNVWTPETDVAITAALGSEEPRLYTATGFVWVNDARPSDYQSRVLTVTQDDLLQLHWDDTESTYRLEESTPLHDIIEVTERMNLTDGDFSTGEIVVITRTGERFRIQMPNNRHGDGLMQFKLFLDSMVTAEEPRVAGAP